MLTQKILSVLSLNRLALKKIFDKLSYQEEKDLEQGINDQLRKVRISPKDKKELAHILDCLLKNERGQYDHMKQKCKEHKLDYKLVYQRGI